MNIAENYIGATTPSSPKTAYMLRLADNALILGQRLSEMCGHAPEMELDLALTNISLDLIGQAKLLFEHILTLEDLAPNADVLALTRPQDQYTNLLLVAQPNVDFAHIVLRQYLFSTMQKSSMKPCLAPVTKRWRQLLKNLSRKSPIISVSPNPGCYGSGTARQRAANV